MKGRFIEVLVVEESSLLAFSAASTRRWAAILSFERSIPSTFLNSNHPLDDLGVEVVAAEVVVAACGLDLEDALTELQDGDVESTATKVEDEDGLVLLLVHTVGQ